MFGLDPRKMQAVMRQMGIKQEEVPVERVIFESAEKQIVIDHASVQKIIMQGQTSWQVTGEAREETKDVTNSAADIEMVAEKTGKSNEEARKALQETGGDIAAAILQLNSQG